VYDPRTEPHEFVGEGRDEAIQRASKFFGIEAEELAISEFGAGDVYGAGGRCVIVAFPRSAPRPRPGSDGGEERGGRRERGGDRDRGGRRERGGRRDRGRHEAREPRESRGGRPERAERAERAERFERAERAERTEPVEPEGPSVGSVAGEIGDLGSFVLGVVERMDLGSFEVSESQDVGGLLVIHVRGPAARRLADGEGRAVDALQLLLNQASMRGEGEERQKVVVDVEGDAEGRESFLEAMAERAARRARNSGRAVALEPMNPRDRRVIHVALRDEDDIATMSVGEGRYRQVVVVPEGAPEFEEARRESEEASRSGR
jgi:spoIIIJ-associated protein